MISKLSDMIFQPYKRNKKKYTVVNGQTKNIEKKMLSYKKEGKLEKAKKLEKDFFKNMDERQNIENYFLNLPGDRGMFIGFGVDLDQPDEMEPIYLPWKNLINHTETTGTTRYGKSYLMSYMLEQFVKKRDDVFIIDPKGGENQEIIGWTIESLIRNNREEDFVFINPLFPQASTQFNPIYGLSNEEIASMISGLSQGGGNSFSGDSTFYVGLSYKIIYAILTAYEYLSRAINTEESLAKEKTKELYKYKRREKFFNLEIRKKDDINQIIFPDISERIVRGLKSQDDKFKNESNVVYNRELITFKEISKLISLDEIIKLESAVNEWSPLRTFSEEKKKELEILRNEARTLLKEITKADKTFYEKTSTSLSTFLIQLSSGRIGELFCSTRINPLTMRIADPEKGIVCVMQPVPLKFRQVSDTILKIFLKMLESLFATAGASGRVSKTRTQVLIDEGKAAVFPGIEELYNKTAGLGLSVHVFYQSPKDKDVNLGADLASVVSDNVNTKFIMKPNDIMSAKMLALSLGTVTKQKPTMMIGMQSSRMSTMAESEDVANITNLLKLPIASAYVSHYGKRYRVQFPIVKPPQVVVEMPELEEESLFNEMKRVELEISLSISNILKDIRSEVEHA